jgi:predicted nucleotidyltransferase
LICEVRAVPIGSFERGDDMQRRDSLLMRKALNEIDAGIVFASIFGSYRRGDQDAHSDIDVLVVHEEEDEKDRITQGLRRLERELRRPIHINLFSLREFDRRVRFHDYLMASILEDSSFVLGRKDIFLKAKRNLLEGHPDNDSVRFNMQMGFKILNDAYSFLDRISSSEQNRRENLLDYAIRGLNNYRLALGYIIAGALIYDLGRSPSYNRIVQTNLGPALKEIALIESEIKRASEIDSAKLFKIAEEIKDRSLRFLSLNRISLTGLASLLESSFAKPSIRSRRI